MDRQDVGDAPALGYTVAMSSPSSNNEGSCEGTRNGTRKSTRADILAPPLATAAKGTEVGIDERIWLTVCAIPPGKVATYGDIARRAGLAGAARRVGAALRKLPQGTQVPWHRVVNAAGRSSLPPGTEGADRQRALLLDEGVILGAGGAAVLRNYRW